MQLVSQQTHLNTVIKSIWWLSEVLISWSPLGAEAMRQLRLQHELWFSFFL